jgi:hypothetical protein
VSNDTNFYLTFSCPNRQQLEHVLCYLEFKKARWEYWKATGKDTDALCARVGTKSPAAVVSWGFSVDGDIEESPSGMASVTATAWANQNLRNVWISGDNGEIADLRQRFSFLTIDGTYKDEYGVSGDV